MHYLPGISALNVVEGARGVRDRQDAIPLQQRQRRHAGLQAVSNAPTLRVKAIHIQQQHDAREIQVRILLGAFIGILAIIALAIGC